MSINDNTPRNQYTAAAAQTVFIYDFEIFEAVDLLVLQTLASTGVTNILTVTADYAVTGVGSDGGGTVVLTLAASAGDIITIVGQMDLDRLGIDYTVAGAFTAPVVNADFDRIVAMIKQLDMELGLKLGVAFESTTGPSTADALLAAIAAAQAAAAASAVSAAASAAAAAQSAAQASPSNLLQVIDVTVAQQTITFNTGIDINLHNSYRIELDLPGSNDVADIEIRANANANSNDYTSRGITNNGGGVNEVTALMSAKIADLTLALTEQSVTIFVRKSTNAGVNYTFHAHSISTTDTLVSIFNVFKTVVEPSANITQLDLIGGVAAAFPVGTQARIYTGN